MRTAVRRVGLAMVLAMSGAAAMAQWSIGAAGDRAIADGAHRYAFMVFANSRPGQEQAFNDWYDYEHQGDLTQLPGWTGVQRFRLVSQIDPRPTTKGYAQGYLAWWDQETSDPNLPRAALDAAQDGGKARRSDTFDYVAGASPKAFYERVGPRVTRSDGQAPSIPAQSDNRSVRQHRFLILDFADRPAATSVQAYEAALANRIRRTLALPGWMAAQRLRAVPTPGPRGRPAEQSPFPHDLIAWEVQAPTAQAPVNALAAATKAGMVPAPADPATAILTFWQPLGPYVTRDAFAR